MKPTRTESALRKVGYQSPTCRPISNEDWHELESQLAYLRGDSLPCRGCGGPLLPGQPEGAYCKSCAQELASLKYQDDTNDIRTIGFFIVGVFVGVPLTVMILKWSGWMP